MPNKYTTEAFIIKANSIHPDKYRYDNAIYVDSKTHITITCPIHGDFKQKPAYHLYGDGCRKCANELIHKKQRSTTDEFIAKSKKIFGDLFTYNLVEYINNYTKIILCCKIHGSFYQTPNDHLCGSGCPKCNSSKGENEISRLLELRGIAFCRQKRFKNCKNKYPLPFDFAILVSNKVIGLIEFHGRQHYTPIKQWGGSKNLAEIQRRDNIKKQYCEKQKLPLLTISYTENIEEKLYKWIETL